MSEAHVGNAESSMTDMPQAPAERLVGEVLNGKWLVTERLARDSSDTGQSRSSCYVAMGGERLAFVKAFDFRWDERSMDTDRLERNVREFNHEKNLHDYCRDLTRVTRIYDHGKIVLGDGAVVHFIVCEFAPRSYRSYQPPGDESVPAHERLYSLRKIASALVQLHAAGIAHQDVKPSNAVCFDDQAIKITDLGSASCIHLPPPPHDEDPIVGQLNYAPYELHYRSGLTTTWQQRRFGCDAFLLGNLIFTSFVGGSMTVLVMHRMHERMRPSECSCTYEEVLPDLASAHFALVPDFLRVMVPEAIADDLIDLVLALTNPDPSKRGLAPNGGRLDLHRCVGTLNTLALRAKMDHGRKAKLDRRAA